MRLELIRKGINLGHSYSIVYEFNNYYYNTIGFRKIGSYGHINQQYWSIEGRKGYEEWWVNILNVMDKSFNI